MKEADLWCPLCNDVQCVFFVSLLARKSYTFSRSVFVGEHVLIQTHTWPHTSPQLHWLPNISVSFELWFMFLPFLGVLFWPCSPTNQQAEFPWAMAAMASGHGYSASIGASVIELDDGKIYRKALYLMVKTMVSCRFSLKPIHWIRYILPDGTIDPLKMGIPRRWDAHRVVFRGSFSYWHGGFDAGIAIANGWGFVRCLTSILFAKISIDQIFHQQPLFPVLQELRRCWIVCLKVGPSSS